MVFYLGAEISVGVYNSIRLAGVHLKDTYPSAEPISEGLMLIAVNLLFYIFYATIYTFGQEIMGQSSFWPRLNRFHWVLMGIFVAISIVDFAWYVYNILGQMQYIRPKYTLQLDHYQIWSKIMSVKWILFWVGSWEILGAMIFMGMRTSSQAPHMRMSTYLTFTASGFFFALNGLWAIWSINSYLAHIYPTQVAIAAREVVQFFFCMGTYLGLGLCAWRFPAKLNDDLEDAPVRTMIIRRSERPVEADSRTPLAVKGTSEIDRSLSVAEVAATRPILEADSNITHEKP
ncbi:unnamed protein product [Penicillium manginii]